MPHCESFDPDNVFRNFKLLEFPISFVGLSTTQELDVVRDVTGTSYLKTSYEGSIMDFEEARELSPSHRSYVINLQDCHTLQITFTPSNECIAKVKLKKLDFANRFVFDLRVINVEGVRCCNDERHAEVGRYYISGQYEYCNIMHAPNVVDFGDIAMKSKVTRTIRIRNESKLISAKIAYIKVTGYDVIPKRFCIPPKSSKKIEITLNPNSLKVVKALEFHIRNPHDTSEDLLDDTNFLPYIINTQANIYIGGKRKETIVPSMHTIFEPSPFNTYMNEELDKQNERKMLANQFLQFSKSMQRKKCAKEKFCSSKPVCYDDPPILKNPLKTGRFFCKDFRERIRAPDLFHIFLYPQSLDFGKVAIKTYGEQNLTVKNESKYDICLKFTSDKNILYTTRKLREYTMKLKSNTEMVIAILCFGFQMGTFKETFKYIIDTKFSREYVYKVQIENPVLTIPESSLKFGMATSEGFISSVPVKIMNDFNIPLDFEWEDLSSEVPFEIVPKTGNVPMHSCKICDLTYISKLTKTKTFAINLLSKGNQVTKIITIEANIISRKISVKFLQQILLFKDIPLNMDTTRIVKLENSSREIAVFYVVDPLLPGITVEPMSGVMRPKSLISFQVTLKIPCVIDFTYDLCIRVNNKEMISLTITGNTMEPKLNMSPRNVFMPRVPCGMITYVPVSIQNTGHIQSLIEIIDTGDENMFDVYVQDGNIKRKVQEFTIRPGHFKTVFVKVYDVFRREYDMYIPFKINGLLGPPNMDESCSTQFDYYTAEYEELYENNVKVKMKTIHKDINYFRIIGVFTVPWIELSVEHFEIEYTPNGNNSIEFTMTNVSRYYLHVCILTSKLYPHFSLDITTEDGESIINETCIKFELDRGRTVEFCLDFHPHGLGTISTVATLYLDKAMSLPFHNLLFTGRREFPAMTTSTHRIIFPPCHVGTELSQTTTVTLEAASELSSFTCSSKEEKHICVELVDCKVTDEQGEKPYTCITVRVTVSCDVAYARNLSLVFYHECGSSCSVEVCFCFTYCPLTLHANAMVTPEENPFPFYPSSTQTNLYDYMETSVKFLERWIFQQGFRRELFPIIPDTFHAIAYNMVSSANLKIKGINLSMLNFMRRIAGPLMKHVHKAASNLEEPYKSIKDIHDTYKSIINLLRSRGANLWLLQAKFLLTHAQYVLLSEFEPPVYDADVHFTEMLKQDPELFARLAKQCWFDLILQCYKVFVLDSCFFDCICVSSEPRDIEMILVNWYNEQIKIGRHQLHYITSKEITNLTTDLSNGIAIISAIYNHCPFVEETLCLVCDVDEENPVGGIVHNACIIIEIMNMLRMFFPLTSKDFLEPNYLHMLFLSIHLFVVLPMYRPKDTILFEPPLLRTSSRTVSINPVSQEGLQFNYVILNNHKNSFSVEKIPPENNSKKISVFVRFTANFASQDKAILLVHGYNKTRIFDTYMTFTLVGNIGALTPLRKCKLTAPIYRPNRVDVTVFSPFTTTAFYKIYVTDVEPTIPMVFEDPPKKGFCFKRLTLVDDEMVLAGLPKTQNADVQEYKIYLHLYCLNTQSENAWIWFRSEIGEFFVKLTTHPRWDLAVDTLPVKVQNWPVDPCSCGEACECYRTSILMIPHRNDLMLKALRYAMAEFTTDIMMNIYDTLIETTTGLVVLSMLLSEGGTKMSELAHILRAENTYRISSKNLLPRQERVVLRQHTDAVFTLPVTVPPKEKSEKFTIYFTSECGMDIRAYKILFSEEHAMSEETSQPRSSN